MVNYDRRPVSNGVERESHTPSFESILARDSRDTTSPYSLRRPLRTMQELLKIFSPSERLLLYILTLILGISTFVLVANVNEAVSTEVPTHGGSLVEGAVGTPRFINPLLATSQVDQDLTMLTFSGLLRASGSGEYIPDLAEKYDISEDGTTYTFHLREGITFHDGTPLTSADVLYTVSLAQNPDIKSIRRADWDGVTVAAPDERTVVFTLPHAYAPFRENATLGILPKHLWESVPSEEFPFASLNTHPVGSGPYKLEDATFDTTGAPTEYILKSFKGFALGEANINRIVFRVFPNEDALVAAYESGDIESFVAASPKRLPRHMQEGDDMQTINLARVYGVFFNQNHAPILAKAEVRAALDMAVDKEAIVRDVLSSYGEPLISAVPPGLLEEGIDESEATTTEASTSTPETEEPAVEEEAPINRAEEARAILSRAGWKYDEAAGAWKKDSTTLSMTLATVDTEELVATAEKIAEAWRAAGIPTTVQLYPLQEFNQTVLRPRSYDAILFGEVVGRSLDLFAFWHSSQRNDPGLNIAQYTNPQADRLLASARAETDMAKREAFLREFIATLSEDKPAIFLYSPKLAYIVPERIRGIAMDTLGVPSDRFVSVHAWYRDTERVWNIFTQ